MSTRSVHESGSMKPLNVQESPASTPYVLSESDAGASSSRASLKTRSFGYLFSNNGKELLFCAVFGTITYFVGYLWVVPTQRPIPYQFLEDTGAYILNLVNNEEYVESTVPELHLGICVLLCPILQLVCGMLYGSCDDTHNTLCVYLLAIPLNELATWTLKVYVGYLRPSFYALCQPDENFDYCTEDEEWQDGRMSFPSGHASYAFCALTLLHLYLEQCMGFSSVASHFVVVENDTKKVVFQQPANALKHRVVSILCLVPLALAIFIACSRVVDNKHFPADVVAGSLLGASIARYFHFLWFRDHKIVHM